jgi:hypothetical protein
MLWFAVASIVASCSAGQSADGGLGGGSAVGGGGAGGGGTATLDAGRSGLLVPLYIYPSTGAWAPLLAAARSHSAVPVLAIVNPSSGPGTSLDST